MTREIDGLVGGRTGEQGREDGPTRDEKKTRTRLYSECGREARCKHAEASIFAQRARNSFSKGGCTALPPTTAVQLGLVVVTRANDRIIYIFVLPDVIPDIFPISCFHSD